MSTALAKTEKVTGWLDRAETQERIGSALAGWMQCDEFIAQFLIACQSDAIAPCSESSKFAAAHLCASLQLLPSLQQVALIPRNNKGTLECTVMPQFQGYKSLMERHPDVLEVDYDIVFEGESYSRDSDGTFFHNYDPFTNRDVKKGFENVRGGYLVIKYVDLHRPYKYHFITIDTIKKAKACAQTKNVWDNWPGPMLIKTLYRDGFARRVVPIDTLVNRKLVKLTEVDDVVLQNSPHRPSRIVVDHDKHLEQARIRYQQQSIESNIEQAAQAEPQEETQPEEDADVLSAFVSKLSKCKTQISAKKLFEQAGAQPDDVAFEMAAALERRINELKG